MAHLNGRTLAAAGVLVLSVSAFAMGSRPKDADEATNKRIAPVSRVQMAAESATAAVGSRSGEQIYKAVCGACHDSGVANAPKLGDKAAWAPRIALGLDGLMKSAIAGKGGMPPRGASDANDAELARAIAYVANKSGGNLKEPAAK
ncbi:c-type cytochrome [Sulfuritalea sp.]|uniref:c-type cytochrome n=1 Tax=Sulfuritalea sp. TaxID=2480090 RepID=UPI0025DCCC5A|nr:c-type cytochrome [Sulfuritalea sp.]